MEIQDLKEVINEIKRNINDNNKLEYCLNRILEIYSKYVEDNNINQKVIEWIRKEIKGYNHRYDTIQL